ncbi:MAG: hypothetical protein Q8N23_08080 [Archangium sp.]|nr:hypothetical protein [Archangium sp.]MDP3152611.1 hypothetical protein [Archangium sp.]MDP3571031.1 hypothetical protein [Archangium sp.]
MKKLFVTLLVLAGCGPEQRGPGFPVELYVTAGLLDDLSAFQISLVTKGSSLDCVAVQKACIKDQVDATRFVKLKDSTGKEGPSLTFPIVLVAGSPNTQDVSLTDVPLGKDLALIVEAVSKESTPRLAGSSCNYVKELTAGTNAAVPARIEVLSPRAACDPRH